jgi:SPP1 gp7 family putative phage head morphogenesis protein
VITGNSVERWVRRSDAQLRRLERDAITRLDAALRQSAAALERDLQRLYIRTLDETANLSRAIAEARVRSLLTQVRSLQLMTPGSPSVFNELILQSYGVGLENALTSLTAYQRQLSSLAGGVDIDRVSAATQISNRLIDIGNARAANAQQRLLQHTADAAQAIERHVTDGIIRGQGWGKTAREIRREVKITRNEAERIVRTESVAASDEARRERFRESGVEYVQVVVTMDERLCGYCANRAGRVYRLDDIQLPFHPNCLVGDTHVLARGVSGHSKRWYEGPVVTITTRQGNRLTCTPNHPILTPGGWVAAGRLNVGSHVISSLGSDGINTRDLNDEYVKGRIENVIDTLSQWPEMASRPVPVASEHFHGDGGGSKVAVIGANRHLWGGFDAALEQKVKELAFVLAAQFSVSLQGFGLQDKRFLSNLAASSSFICSHHLTLALTFSHTLPLDSLGFTLASGGNAALEQSSVNDISANLPLFSELIDRFSIQVGADEIVDIRQFDFAGHVFNLETKDGFYVAQGIITHNCRCTTSPWRPEWQELGLTDDDWYKAHRQESLERAQEPQKTGPSPSERWRGLTDAPTPIWSP